MKLKLVKLHYNFCKFLIQVSRYKIQSVDNNVQLKYNHVHTN